MDEKPTSGSTRAVRRTSNGEADRYLHDRYLYAGLGTVLDLGANLRIVASAPHKSKQIVIEPLHMSEK